MDRKEAKITSGRSWTRQAPFDVMSTLTKSWHAWEKTISHLWNTLFINRNEFCVPL